MRIGIDARFLGIYRSFGRYAGELIPRLLELDSGNEYLLLGEEGDEEIYRHRLRRAFQFGWLRSRSAVMPKMFKDHLFYPRQLKQFNLDLTFHPDNQMFYFSSLPAVVTVHDLMPLLFPKWFHQKLAYRLSYQIQLRSLAKAAKIIAISRSTKKDLIEKLGIAPQKIEVIYQGVGGQFGVISNQEKLKSARVAHSLPQRFILFVGGFNPHKNLGNLLRAYGNLSRKYPDLQEVGLVVTAKLSGDIGVTEEAFVREVMEQEGVADRVCFVPLEGDAEPLLITLYNLAEVLAMPSYYEGFGMPPLEAMACGTPVASSDRGSLPEVVGEAGILFDPDDVGAMTAALEKVLTRPEEQVRLREAGFNQVKKFNWEECAKQTIELFNSVGGC